MELEALRQYLALYFVPGIGPRRLISLCQYFGGPERAFVGTRAELERVPGMGKATVDAILDSKNGGYERAGEQLEKVFDGRAVLTFFDAEYPEALRSIYDPPAVLFLQGNKTLLTSERKIAIVGTRSMTEYGKRSARQLAEDLVREGAVIVSGFARGVDTTAHIAAAEFGGATIAVLGSGLDVIYPAANKNLAKELLASERGLFLSELPFGSQPDARNFPWRNRIVSGLSQGVVVVESDEKGGSMITASIALDQNRDVFALPGDTSRPMSSGANKLIRESRARLIRGPVDLLEDLGWRVPSGRQRSNAESELNRAGLNMFENRIVDVLLSAGSPLQIDQLTEQSSLEVQDILVHLLNLEFKGVVRQMAGKQFMLV